MSSFENLNCLFEKKIEISLEISWLFRVTRECNENFVFQFFWTVENWKRTKNLERSQVVLKLSLGLRILVARIFVFWILAAVLTIYTLSDCRLSSVYSLQYSLVHFYILLTTAVANFVVSGYTFVRTSCSQSQQGPTTLTNQLKISSSNTRISRARLQSRSHARTYTHTTVCRLMTSRYLDGALFIWQAFIHQACYAALQDHFQEPTLTTFTNLPICLCCLFPHWKLKNDVDEV